MRISTARRRAPERSRTQRIETAIWGERAKMNRRDRDRVRAHDRDRIKLRRHQKRRRHAAKVFLSLPGPPIPEWDRLLQYWWFRRSRRCRTDAGHSPDLSRSLRADF